MEYAAQSGDTLEAVASHFNSTVEEIRNANPGLPRKVTTLTPGMVVRVPAYFAPFSGTPFQILPDSELVAGPTIVAFSTYHAVASYPGFLNSYADFAFGHNLAGWQMVDTVSRDFSVHPRVLLALLEYRTQAVTLDDQTDEEKAYPLGKTGETLPGLAIQLSWAAGMLNEGYYGWRTGTLKTIELADGRLTRPDSWQNAGTVAVQYLLAQWFGQADFDAAVGPDGFIQTYRRLFGDPAGYAEDLIPGGLEQPAMQLPFEPLKTWIFTGGPHAVWGEGLPWAAIDFAPPSAKSGCQESAEWVTAVAAGTVVRSGESAVLLDLDGDGNEHTGWDVLYYHIADADRVAVGTELPAGGRIGHPSCEGGRAIGTNLHMARRYNGEWISAAGPLAFDLSDWIVGIGSQPYDGTLSYYLSDTLTACSCVADNRIELFPRPTQTP